MQISKLDGMEARYMALEDQLSDPSVIADQNRWRELSKEHAELGEIVSNIENIRRHSRGSRMHWNFWMISRRPISMSWRRKN